MKNILLFYIVIINLIGFFIMGIDKHKARRNRWRVKEKTLFLIALLFGSPGVLVGMYFFRHKTKHLSFTIGIPFILVLQLVLIGGLLYWKHHRMTGPSYAVQSELERIEELDPDTISAFVSYENLMNSRLSAGSINEEAAGAVALFFQNFKYDIVSESVHKDSAEVYVDITNIDTRFLAQDLCRAILQESVVINPSSEPVTTGDYYRLLADTLKAGEYETKTTQAVFYLSRQENGWIILMSETLEDQLVSGFISNMNDPYILPVSEILKIHLDALKELSAEEWKEYLQIQDIFATYNLEYSEQIDTAFVTQLADAFDYSILKCDEAGDTAHASLRIYSVDMQRVLGAYKEKLLAYASTTQSIRDDSTQFSNVTAEALLNSLVENQTPAGTDIDMEFHNNGKTWEIYFDETFTDALLGGMTTALETFNENTPD